MVANSVETLAKALGPNSLNLQSLAPNLQVRGRVNLYLGIPASPVPKSGNNIEG